LRIAQEDCVKNFLLLVVVAGLAFWWLKRDTPSSDSVHGSTTVRSTARAKTSANPQAAPQNQDSDRERRKALADEYARSRSEREAKEAAYWAAMADYEAKRTALYEQIDGLGRANKKGVNNAAMAQLSEQLLRLPRPERP
jgi:hypothetical protein